MKSDPSLVPSAKIRLIVYLGLFLWFDPVWSYIRWFHIDLFPSAYHLDYLMRVVLLCIVFTVPSIRTIALEPSRDPAPFGKNVTAFFFMFGVSCFIYFFLKLFFDGFLGVDALFRWPEYPTLTVKLFDLTVGLALVATTEELVFRKFALQALDAFSVSPKRIFLYSSILFAVIHWETGLSNSLTAFLFGWLAMAVYMSTRRLWPCVLVHYFTNLMIFSSMPVAG